MEVPGTLPVQSLSFPRLIIRPDTFGSISRTIRRGVAEATNVCFREIPAARRNSRERTIRFEASSSTVGFHATTVA
jgi:hypothetical protein